MKQVLKCSATNKELTNDVGSVIFKCPNCMDAEIIRSKNSRVLGTRYKCPKCDFEGPN
ncbi:MAG: zinc finger domain-containing protein [Nanoarchaeota archaeon]|nr:zinc finger domain-containing protein [Nanoarchaeota archaeon]